MAATSQIAKAALRDEVRASLKKMSLEEQAKASIQVCSRLRRQAAWESAKLVLFFAPLPGEVDIGPLLNEALRTSKAVALPRFDPALGAYVVCQIEDLARDLVVGKLGIREAGAKCRRITPGGTDLILVPGVAFDLNGFRLGRGKGYYDRLLAPLRGLKCGVAFDQQVVNTVPAEEHDVRLDCLLTPTRWVEF